MYYILLILMLSCPAQVCLGEIFTPRSGGRCSLVQWWSETVRDSLLDHQPLRHPHLTVNLAGNVSRRRNVYKFESPEVRNFIQGYPRESINLKIKGFCLFTSKYSNSTYLVVVQAKAMA